MLFCGPVLSRDMAAAVYTANADILSVSPIAGRISKLKVVITTLTAGAGALTIKTAAGTVAGGALVIPTASAVGAILELDIQDTGALGDATTNAIAEGGLIEVESDGVPTAGALSFFLQIEPRD